MKNYLILIFLFASIIISGQETEHKNNSKNIAFEIIEDIPVFPGCVGNSKEKKDCINLKMKTHVIKNFRVKKALQLGLSPGKKTIYLTFIINKKGKVVQIKARGPHPKLEKEAIRVAKKLPKFKPGKLRGVPVNVGYTLPIKFNVE